MMTVSVDDLLIIVSSRLDVYSMLFFSIFSSKAQER